MDPRRFQRLISGEQMKRSIQCIAGALLVVSVVAACAPLVVGVVVAGTAIVATDRRTAGIQVDDQTIQLRLAGELSAAFKERPVHISVNSFDRRVLLTGEVPDEAAKTKAGEVAAASLNVRSVVNELEIALPSSLSERTADTALATKVRAAFVNTREIAFNSVEIVVERHVVYLLGLVTEKEGKIAALVASRVSGVQRVVKVFEYASQEEVDRRRLTGGSAPAK
jgi:osmotically-inducible protein OsmY